jgi:hypothetical protein
LLTEESDQVSSFGETTRENSEGVCLAGIFAANLDGDGRPTRTCLDCVCGSKLDEIGNTDLGLGGNVGEVTAKALQAAVLFV